MHTSSPLCASTSISAPLPCCPYSLSRSMHRQVFAQSQLSQTRNATSMVIVCSTVALMACNLFYLKFKRHPLQLSAADTSLIPLASSATAPLCFVTHYLTATARLHPSSSAFLSPSIPTRLFYPSILAFKQNMHVKYAFQYAPHTPSFGRTKRIT